MIGRIVDIKGNLFNPSPSLLSSEVMAKLWATEIIETYSANLKLGEMFKIQELRRLCGADI